MVSKSMADDQREQLIEYAGKLGEAKGIIFILLVEGDIPAKTREMAQEFLDRGKK